MKDLHFKALMTEWRAMEKMALFQEVVTLIRKKRDLYSGYCNTSRDDVRFFQGHVQAYDDILGKDVNKINIIERILKDLEEALSKKP